ncbi:MAG: HAD-IIB family hydrolase [Cellvibrionaceae bacterium]
MQQPTSTKTNNIYWLIVTDLDGTLLDHHTYSFDAAVLSLKKLEEHNIPVIINSSKTATEIENLRLTLNNRHPFITENGSGIIIPDTYFPRKPKEAEQWKSYWEITLGKPRKHLIDGLKSLPEHFNHCYRAYHQSSAEDIMEMTGLSKKESMLSLDRRYTEPLQWLGNPSERNQFFGHIHKQHIHYTEGGRFIHLMGHTNKGSATTWLSRHYEKEVHQTVKVIALGDGKNDIDMLKAADIAIVIRSPVNEPPEFDHPCKIISTQLGPVGWAECIDNIFFQQTTK